MKRWRRAAINSWNGITSCFATEPAFREELVLIAIAVPFALILSQDIWKRLVLLSPFFLLLIFELLNSAIEKLCDKVQAGHDPIIGRIKDMGSAAIGLTLIGSSIIWIVAIFEYFRS